MKDPSSIEDLSSVYFPNPMKDLSPMKDLAPEVRKLLKKWIPI